MKKTITDLLSKVISIQSTYPHEQRIADYLYQYFIGKKYRLIRQNVEKERDNIIIQKGSGKKTILLYSHLDTIHVTEGWNTNPFECIIDGDKAYGIGAWDMKGGMVANIITFLKYQPKHITLKLLFCVDEENISKGGHAFINSSSGKKIDCVISTEPAFCYGIQGIVIGRIGRAVYQVKIKGQAKHVAFYEKKYDINLLLGEFLNELRKLNIKEGKEKKQFIFARKINSESIGMSIPAETTLELESSILPPETHSSILNKLKQLARRVKRKYENFTITINYLKRITPFLESYEIKKNNPYLQTLEKSVIEITKKPSVSYFRSSVADENIFGSRGMTVLGIGPEGENAHAPNEWVSLSSIEKLHNILHNFLTKIDH